jgi:predicted Kef-type K+ transport protein
MDFIWVFFAFICGLIVHTIGLPPLIGFLTAGFILHFIGIEPGEVLEHLSSLGITLMLFTIGLKMHVGDLLKREVWAGTLSHMGIWMLISIGLMMFLSMLSLPYFIDIDLQTAALLAFAMSFSSTVCVVKLLEENGEIKTRHGQLAIAILVTQDIVAVLFLVASTGKIPSIWALSLLGLLFIRPVLSWLLQLAKHGEMLPLAGFFLALGGYELFQLVGIKGDLGALIFGMLLSQHPKANELTKSLLGFKDLFLIGFFLSIGFTALPTWPMAAIALILSLLIVIKFLMFFFILTRLRLRGRTAYLAGLALANFSEFGLIVVDLSIDIGWLSKDWLVILALAVSFSFLLTSVFYPMALFQPKDAEILVIGLGRVGKGAIKSLQNMVDNRVAGIDSDQSRVRDMRKMGMNVINGDGEDADFWESFDTSVIRLVLLALPSIDDSRNVTEQLRGAGYQGVIAAIARYEDQREQLLLAGIDKVFNFYREAGSGFAEDSLQLIQHGKLNQAG